MQTKKVITRVQQIVENEVDCAIVNIPDRYDYLAHNKTEVRNINDVVIFGGWQSEEGQSLDIRTFICGTIVSFTKEVVDIEIKAVNDLYINELDQITKIYGEILQSHVEVSYESEYALIKVKGYDNLFKVETINLHSVIGLP